MEGPQCDGGGQTGAQLPAVHTGGSKSIGFTGSGSGLWFRVLRVYGPGWRGLGLKVATAHVSVSSPSLP